MKSICEDVKEKFRAIDFFHNCGGYVDFTFQVERIFDWDTASQHFCNAAWEDTTLEASNELSEFIHENFREKYRDWNCYADAGRKFVNEELLERLTSLQSGKALDPIFIDCVKWDLVHSLLFEQYRAGLSVELPDFYSKLIDVYESGHYPCGWSGVYPDGVFVVF